MQLCVLQFTRTHLVYLLLGHINTCELFERDSPAVTSTAEMPPLSVREARRSLCSDPRKCFSALDRVRMWKLWPLGKCIHLINSFCIAGANLFPFKKSSGRRGKTHLYHVSIGNTVLLNFFQVFIPECFCRFCTFLPICADRVLCTSSTEAVALFLKHPKWWIR